MSQSENTGKRFALYYICRYDFCIQPEIYRITVFFNLLITRNLESMLAELGKKEDSKGMLPL